MRKGKRKNWKKKLAVVSGSIVAMIATVPTVSAEEYVKVAGNQIVMTGDVIRWGVIALALIALLGIIILLIKRKRDRDEE